MFGFGKKKIEDETSEQRAFAGLALQATHETQKEILEEFDQYLVDKKGATYAHFGTNQFYSGKMPISEDIIAYLLGFVFGYCQSYGKDESFVFPTLVHFGEGYEKTTNNYLNALGLKYYENSFFDVFEAAWTSKRYLHDEATGNCFIEGLADGKDYADRTNEIERNYSALKWPDTAEKLNLNGLRRIISGFSGQILFSKELMAIAKMPIDWNESQIDEELLRQGFNPNDFK